MQNGALKKFSISFMLLLAAFFCLHTGVQAGEKGDQADSFRYGKSALERSGLSLGLLNVNAWTRSGNAYYSSNGKVINGAYARGIDVSGNNGAIDWNAVKADGVDFAIIRCGYGMNQINQDDSRWIANVTGCEAAGIPYGVYIYSYANSVNRAVSEADHVLRLINGRRLSYPVYFDMEDQSIFSTTTAKQRSQIAKAFCQRIEAAGYEAAIYASNYSFTNELPEETFNKWGRWVAHYNTKCGYKGTYQMWQATNQGRVAGVQGPVDINFLISNQIFVKPTVKVNTAGKKKVKVSWKPKKKGSTVQIYYSKSKKGKYKLLTKNAKKGSVKIKKLKSGKKYYFKVRLSRQLNGVTVCSKYSKTVSVRIR